MFSLENCKVTVHSLSTCRPQQSINATKCPGCTTRQNITYVYKSRYKFKSCIFSFEHFVLEIMAVAGLGIVSLTKALVK